MNIETMRKRKRELGYTAEKLAELSGVPVSTVRKIMSGATRSPRMETIQALERVLQKRQGTYTIEDLAQLREGSYVELLGGTLYGAVSGQPLCQQDVDSLMVKESVAPYITGQTRKTLADYESMPAGWRGELIDGIIYDMGQPSLAHQKAVAEITYQLSAFAREGGHECEVLNGPAGLRLREDLDDTVEPDVMVICDRSKLRRELVVGAPDLIVEVLSPSTRARDLLYKLNLYMRNGVREYWVVDPEEQWTLVYDSEHSRIAERYPFDGKVSVGISGGELSIDFYPLKEALDRLQKEDE